MSYSQPTLPTDPTSINKGWLYNCLDYQVVTKSSSWSQSQTKRLAEFDAGIALGIDTVALAVPYDDTTKYGNYIADARTKGLRVWHRSHWNAWEGDNSASANLSAQDYLDNTYSFIVNNPTFFDDGDLFGMCVECNNANDIPNTTYPFRVGNVVGGAFSYTLYNQFLKDQVSYANAAFKVIGKSVRTNMLSMSLSLLNLDGQQLDDGNTGNASGLGDSDIVQFFDSLLVIDHYMTNTYRSSDAYGKKFSSDLDKIHTAFPNCSIFIGEWGYPTNTALTDDEQMQVFRQVVDVLRGKPYIVGVNFWVHMASSTASIFTDTGGTINANGRACASIVKAAFNTPTNAYLTDNVTTAQASVISFGF